MRGSWPSTRDDDGLVARSSVLPRSSVALALMREQRHVDRLPEMRVPPAGARTSRARMQGADAGVDLAGDGNGGGA